MKEPERYVAYMLFAPGTGRMVSVSVPVRLSWFKQTKLRTYPIYFSMEEAIESKLIIQAQTDIGDIEIRKVVLEA